MSREIEFRAWCSHRKKMLPIITLKAICTANEELSQTEWSDLNIMQYTGLKDKNGTKIFEGDVVNCVPYKKHLKDRIMHGIREVVFDQQDATFYYDSNITMNWGGIASYEVIGNIYENKDLLNN